MLWVKAFHLIFMVAWFAGLFYLPRLFVNHAMSENEDTRRQLSLMARKLYRFITPWMLLTLIFGIWMLVDYAWTAFADQLWLQIKLVLIAVLVGYHFYCGTLVNQFEQGKNQRSHVWFRWFNEFPVIILFAVVLLAVLKPA